MTQPRVLIHSLEPDLALDVLKQTHADLSPQVCTDDRLLRNCVDQYKPEVVFSVRSGGDVFPRSALVESPHIKWISNAGSGVNHLMPWDPQRLTVTNSAGVAADMMAEYALGIMLHFALDINGLIKDKQAKHWQLDRQVQPVKGKTLVLLGLGKTGQALAKKAKALELNVIGVRASPKITEYVDHVYPTGRLDEALAQADYLVVCLPLLDSTTGLLGPDELSQLKNSAVLIDLSRGGIVQEQALISALRQGQLKGAGLDVFETEPLPDDNPLWTFDNVVISPHCSSVYEGWEETSARMFADNLSRWRNQQSLVNVVDPDRGY